MQSNRVGIDELDLKALLLELWQSKWWIAVFPSLSAILMLIYVLVTDNVYRASVVLAPTESSASGALAGLANQFGGLASLAGISLGGGQSQSVNAIAIVRSEAFVHEFIREMHGKPILFAEKWDGASGKWFEPGPVESLIGGVRKVLRGGQGAAGSAYDDPNEPSNIDTYERFVSDHFSVTEDKKTGLITFSIDLKEPALAKTWVNAIVNRLNKKMQDDAKQQAEQSIAFLEKELGSTNLVEMQRSINQLIEAQVKAKMLANVNEQYAFKILAPATVPERQIFPKRALMLVASVILGFIIGIGVVVVRYFWSQANAGEVA